jgi:dTMP kinase
MMRVNEVQHGQLIRTDHGQLRGPVPSLALQPHGTTGVLATFDGVDGSGKTTTIETMCAVLGSCGITAEVVKMPSPEVRGISYFRQFADDHRAAEDGRVDPAALFMVLLGDRLLTVRKRVMPLLRQGRWVICDRYVYMTFAQMATYGADPADLAALVAITELFPAPDLPCVAHVPAELAISRVHARPEERHARLHHDIITGFTVGLREVARANGVHLVPTDTAEQTEAFLRSSISGLRGALARA